MPDVLHTVEVDLTSVAEDRSYDIHIGRGLIGDATIWRAATQGRGVVLVTDDQVGPLYGPTVKGALSDAAHITEVVLPAGEASTSTLCRKFSMRRSLTVTNGTASLSPWAEEWSEI